MNSPVFSIFVKEDEINTFLRPPTIRLLIPHPNIFNLSCPLMVMLRKPLAEMLKLLNVIN